MKLITSTYKIRKHMEDDEAIRMLAQAGFDGVDLALDNMIEDDCIWNSPAADAEADKLRLCAQQSGIGIYQTHSPFRFLWADEEHYRRVALPRMARCIELTARLGADLCVVHPLHYLPYVKYADKMYRDSIELYEYLLPYAKQYNVTVALENMFQFTAGTAKSCTDMYADAPELLRALKDLNDPHFAVCYDTGHALLTGNDPADTLRQLGSTVKALHISDNNTLKDQHLPPYLGVTNWDSVMQAVADIGFDGYFDLELISYYERFSKDLLPAAARFSCEIGRSLIKKAGK